MKRNEHRFGEERKENPNHVHKQEKCKKKQKLQKEQRGVGAIVAN